MISTFVGGIAFFNPKAVNPAKISIMLASTVSGLGGAVWMLSDLAPKPAHGATP